MRAVWVLVLALVLLTGCGSGGARIGEKDLSRLVLQPSDLPAFVQFAFGQQSSIDAHSGPRKDTERFGRLGGWIARYRSVDPAAKGPHVVESRADLFPSSSSAKKDLDAYGAEYAELIARNGGRRLDAPDVGDDARAFAFGAAADRFYLLAWRDQNATASVVVEGPSVGLNDALALARKQHARIAAAAAS